MAMLEVKNLEVYYGVIQAIKGISFEVNEGDDTEDNVDTEDAAAEDATDEVAEE